MLLVELKRAFCNIRYYIALLIGVLIVLLYFYFNVYRCTDVIWEDGFDYPCSAYNYWIGSDPINVIPTILFFSLPLIVAFPYVGTGCWDIHDGYAKNILTRVSKKSYYLSKTIATFLSSASITGIILVSSFLLTTAYIPTLTPQVGLGMEAIGDNSFLHSLYFTHPTAYVMIYILINIIFFGLLSNVALVASFFINNHYIASLVPFAVYFLIYVITSLIDSYDCWNPVYILRPVQSIHTSWYVFAAFFAVFILVVCINLIVSIRKERII